MTRDQRPACIRIGDNHHLHVRVLVRVRKVVHITYQVEMSRKILDKMPNSIAYKVAVTFFLFVESSWPVLALQQTQDRCNGLLNDLRLAVLGQVAQALDALDVPLIQPVRILFLSRQLLCVVRCICKTREMIWLWSKFMPFIRAVPDSDFEAGSRYPVLKKSN